ncbi:hypothetical protein E2C01_063002 [Portunus trituberculatus]|uniref:Uncharacterized protein n=1 Tax=Portunus trituberculatus TaxID=210409 RepID=A0A5B7HCK4_PORTR|nr:hypothetical protein [Portunus trituberculatus]
MMFVRHTGHDVTCLQMSRLCSKRGLRREGSQGGREVSRHSVLGDVKGVSPRGAVLPALGARTAAAATRRSLPVTREMTWGGSFTPPLEARRVKGRPPHPGTTAR